MSKSMLRLSLIVGASVFLVLCFVGCQQNSGKGSVRLVNSTSTLTLTTLNISLTTSSDWGQNYLTASLVPGAQVTVTGITPGTYDLRVITADAQYTTKYGVYIDANQTYTWAVTAGKSGQISGEDGSYADEKIVSYGNPLLGGAAGDAK